MCNEGTPLICDWRLLCQVKVLWRFMHTYSVRNWGREGFTSDFFMIRAPNFVLPLATMDENLISRSLMAFLQIYVAGVSTHTPQHVCVTATIKGYAFLL
jgi:hypothetical protein